MKTMKHVLEEWLPEHDLKNMQCVARDEVKGDWKVKFKVSDDVRNDADKQELFVPIITQRTNTTSGRIKFMSYLLTDFVYKFQSNLRNLLADTIYDTLEKDYDMGADAKAIGEKLMSYLEKLVKEHTVDENKNKIKYTDYDRLEYSHTVNWLKVAIEDDEDLPKRLKDTLDEKYFWNVVWLDICIKFQTALITNFPSLVQFVVILFFVKF